MCLRMRPRDFCSMVRMFRQRTLQQLADAYAESGSSVLAVGKLKINRRNYGLARLSPEPNGHGLRPIELVAEKPDARHPISCSEPPCDPDGVRTVLGRGQLAKSNAEQVAKMRRLIEELGYQVATPKEARAILGLKGADRTKL